MNLIKCYFTQSAWYKGAKKDSTPVGILWHDTAVTNDKGEHVGQVYLRRYCTPSADDPNKEELLKVIGKPMSDRHWNNANAETGVNAFIGKLADDTIGTVQTSDFTTQSWGCGKASKGSLNGYYYDSNGTKIRASEHWVQFEICDDGYKSKEYFDDVYKEACEFTALVCEECGIDPMGTHKFNGVDIPNITCHGEAHKLGFASDHPDVKEWFDKFGKTMDDVRRDVKDIIDSHIEDVEEPVVVVEHTYEDSHNVEETPTVVVEQPKEDVEAKEDVEEPATVEEDKVDDDIDPYVSVEEKRRQWWYKLIDCVVQLFKHIASKE